MEESNKGNQCGCVNSFLFPHKSENCLLRRTGVLPSVRQPTDDDTMISTTEPNEGEEKNHVDAEAIPIKETDAGSNITVSTDEENTSNPPPGEFTDDDVASTFAGETNKREGNSHVDAVIPINETDAGSNIIVTVEEENTSNPPQSELTQPRIEDKSDEVLLALFGALFGEAKKENSLDNKAHTAIPESEAEVVLVTSDENLEIFSTIE